MGELDHGFADPCATLVVSTELRMQRPFLKLCHTLSLILLGISVLVFAFVTAVIAADPKFGWLSIGLVRGYHFWAYLITLPSMAVALAAIWCSFHYRRQSAILMIIFGGFWAANLMLNLALEFSRAVQRGDARHYLQEAYFLILVLIVPCVFIAWTGWMELRGLSGQESPGNSVGQRRSKHTQR